MKNILFIFIFFVPLVCSSQTKEEIKKITDSLSTATNKYVCGFGKAYIQDIEVFYIFYFQNGLMKKETLYTRKYF